MNAVKHLVISKQLCQSRKSPSRARQYCSPICLTYISYSINTYCKDGWKNRGKEVGIYCFYNGDSPYQGKDLKRSGNTSTVVKSTGLWWQTLVGIWSLTLPSTLFKLSEFSFLNCKMRIMKHTLQGCTLPKCLAHTLAHSKQKNTKIFSVQSQCAPNSITQDAFPFRNKTYHSRNF